MKAKAFIHFQSPLQISLNRKIGKNLEKKAFWRSFSLTAVKYVNKNEKI
jgi:hypothetical protein